ncbi:MAG: MerR family transcriptional regulator [Paracoccaceae bacterium]|jgi:DNA-binding transcriptional MerR regulator|nr:MerR family transcriptional regulator [Paracoccaceae bacterium]
MAGKSPEAFRTISEVADWLDRPAHVLRFWESKFNQVKPVKRAGGRRYYRPEDMLLLGGIKKLLHDDGMTIKGAQKVLREQGVRYVSGLSQPLEEDGASQVIEAVAQPEAVPTPAPDAPVPPAPAFEATSFEPHVPELDELEPDMPEPDVAEPEPDMAEAAEDDALPSAPEDEAPAPPSEEIAPVPMPDAPHLVEMPAAQEVVAANTPAAPEAPPAVEKPALGADQPPPPDLDAIRADPGILSAITARHDPLPAAARAAVGPILARLDDLVARMSAGRRS